MRQKQTDTTEVSTKLQKEEERQNINTIAQQKSKDSVTIDFENEKEIQNEENIKANSQTPKELEIMMQCKQMR